MAIIGGDGSITLTTNVDQSGLKKGLGSLKTLAVNFAATVGKAFLAVSAAAGAATIAITKMSVDAYADYEQLVGGVETLFKDSAGKVLEYANEAFRTTGQSANEYMQNVTSFSASLLSAVGGDTEKAAEVANAAMISISDNVNKMGSSAESVQLAFQGFAKQQYMLLDNLKLGYGGTKTEMERLLKDAQAITGVKYDIDNLADVYTAIGVIQEKLGIAGTTAREASTTISGSAATMKAAWQNVLTAIAGGGDLEKSIENLVDSIGIYFENIVPVVERSLQGIGTLVAKIAPMLVQTVAKFLIRSIPNLLAAVYKMIVGLAKGIVEGIKALFTGGTIEVIEEQAESISKSVVNQNELTEAVEETEKAAKSASASFDEINTISKQSSDIDVPDIGGTSIGGVFDSVEAEAVEEVTDRVTSKMELMFTKISDLAKNVWDSTPVQSYKKAAEITFKGMRNSFFNLVDYWKEIWIDIRNIYDEYAEEIGADLSNFFVSIFADVIEPGIRFQTKVLEDYTKALGDVWKRNGDAILQDAIVWGMEILEVFQSLWDNVLAPIIVPLFQAISDSWDEYVQPLLGKIGDFLAKVIELVTTFYSEVLAPIYKFVHQFFKPILDVAGGYVYDFVMNIFSQASGVISAVIDIFSGFADFLIGIFTLDLGRSFSGIKTLFKGLLDGILSIFKGILNTFIATLNGLIRGVNLATGIINKIPGVDIPEIKQIPKLAQGTVVPPNKEFMAILGDNKTEHEIVSPLSTMKQAFLEALQTAGSVGASQDNRPIILQIDGREIARATREGNASLGTQTVFGGFANAY